jgi:NAD(P)-dependent dehydrogenase (short-subunit alcohol dehydrogenase family)
VTDAGRVIVITGAAQGIGRATALEAGARGMRVVGVDINAAGLDETLRMLRARGAEGFAYPCDISDIPALERAFDSIGREVGAIDVLVNSATLVIHVEPETITPEEWNRVMGVALTGSVFAAQFAGRSMIAAGRGGSIINLTSIAGLAALGRGNFAYSVAKAALIGVTRELAIEWAGFGIRVNAVAPSQVNTEGFRGLIDNASVAGGAILSEALPGIPLGRLAEAHEIVAAILFLAGDDASFISGVTLPVDGGSLALHAGGSLRSPKKAAK